MPAEQSGLAYAQIVRRVRDFLCGRLLVRVTGVKLTEDTLLLERGVLDSTGVLELVSFLEQEFSIAVADEEIIPSNLDSLRQIAGYICRKLKESPEPSVAVPPC